MTQCPICGAAEHPWARKRVLGKYDVEYRMCAACGFLHTEKPYWLGEAYADAIVASDTGIARRNLDSQARAAILFLWMFGAKGRFVDVAGGYGLFTRLMRDIGFDYYWSDRYAENLFARGFEAVLDGGTEFEGATAFEVLEHVENPKEFLIDVIEKTHCKAILLSTELYSGDVPPESWWYYGLNTGQHISFFHLRTLKTLADSLGLRLNSHGSFHLLSRAGMSDVMYALLTSRVSSALVPVAARVFLKSRIMADHYRLLPKGST